MITHKSIWWKLGGGLLVASVLAVGGTGALQAQDKQASVAQQLGGSLGVVDYNNLLKAHPDYERLQQFDDQLVNLKTEIETIPLLEKQRQGRQIEEKLKKEYLKAQAEMEAEKAAVEAEMSGMSGAIKSKLDALAAQRQAEMRAKIEAYVKKHAPEQASAPDESPVQMPSANDAAKNLMLLAQRKKEAIKLEVQKAHREQVEAERARIDSEIAAYENEVMKSHQQEKLNLQLKVQVAKDEAEQAELQAQLEAISDEEERLKDAKRAELEGGYKAFRAESEATEASEIKSKQAAVDSEVRAKLGGLPDPAPAAAPQAKRPKQPEMTAELKKMIKDEEARLTAEMTAAADEARRKMEAEQSVQMERLKKKSAELKQRIEKVQADLRKVMETAAKEGISPATQEKIDMKQAQFDKLEAQRKELYDKMVADLKGDIGNVARDKKVDIIIGDYKWKNDEECTDLTDYAMVAIKTKSRPESP